MGIRKFLRWAGSLVVTTGAARSASTQSVPAAKEPDISTLMVVLREMEGANKKDTALQPVGSATATIGGKKVEIYPAWFSIIGDMHIRFVYDGKKTMLGLSAEKFSGLHLSPDQAVLVAVQNICRTYGKPYFSPWKGGLFLVEGGSPDLGSSYFLDREFWRNLLRQHPQGLVVGVPKRGGLLFVPASDLDAVDGFRRGIVQLFKTSGSMRVSSALYLFKDDQWSVFQDPQSMP